MLRGMRDLPRPGLEPVSPALAGGFLTTAPPGKPLSYILILKNIAMNLVSRQLPSLKIRMRWREGWTDG